MVSIPLATGYNKGASIRFDASRLVNFFAVPAQAGQNARSSFYLEGVAGRKEFTTVGSTPARGIISAAGMLYVVTGNSLYRVTTTGSSTNLGTITGSGVVSIAKISGSSANQQIIIVADTESFHFDVATTTLSKITDADFRLAGTVTSLNNKAIFSAKGTGQFFYSALGDGRTYDALDFATAEDNDDNLVAVYAKYSNLFLCGEETTQVVSDNGNGYSNLATIDTGLASKKAISSIKNAIYWLGNDGIAYRAQGYTPTEISTFAIADIFYELDRTDAIVYAYSQRGHDYVVYNFPKSQRVFVFDASTRLWHESTVRGKHHALAFNKNLVTDANSNAILEVDSNYYADGSNPIIRICDLSFISDGINSFNIERVEFVIETGRGGFGSGDDTDPQVMFSWSKDGGRTYGNPVRATAGNEGQYRTRVVFRNLGQFDIDAVLRLQVSSKTPWRIIAADAFIASK